MTILLPAILLVFATSAVFLYAMHARWFARMEKGFLLAIILAVAGAGVLSMLLLGAWGFGSGKQLLFEQVLADLSNVGEIAEANLQSSVKLTRADLAGVAHDVPTLLVPDKKEELGRLLRIVVYYNRGFLQLDAFSSRGDLMGTGSMLPSSEGMKLSVVHRALEGEEVTSEAYISPLFKRYVLCLAMPVRDGKGQIVGAMTALYDLQADLSNLFRSVKFNRSGYAVVTNNDGRILAHHDERRINDDISSYEAVQRARRGETGWAIAKNQPGESRLMVYRALDSPASGNPKPWVLLSEINYAEAIAPINAFRTQFVIAILVLTLVCLGIGYQVSLSIRRPINKVIQSLKKVQGGDLSGQVPFGGRDEIGQLGDSFNLMLRGLREREQIKDLFGRYVATQVSDTLLKDGVNLGGQNRRVTILFSDIRNFTSMSEQMTPQQVVEFLNEYFSEMVEAVFEQGGVLDKFLGDGMMATFGTIGEMPDHPRRAVQAALRMKARLGKINGDRSVVGKPPIAIGIGIHTDDVIVGNIGTRKRLEYTVIGDGVNTSARIETLNKEFGTTLLISETTYMAVKDYFECRLMPEAALKGKSKPIAFYEVVSVKVATTA
jgi:class 3 adenylate cyclase